MTVELGRAIVSVKRARRDTLTVQIWASNSSDNPSKTKTNFSKNRTPASQGNFLVDYALNSIFKFNI